MPLHCTALHCTYPVEQVNVLLGENVLKLSQLLLTHIPHTCCSEPAQEQLRLHAATVSRVQQQSPAQTVCAQCARVCVHIVCDLNMLLVSRDDLRYDATCGEWR